MKILFLTLYFIVILFLLLCIARCAKQKDSLARPVTILIFMAFLTIFFNAISIVPLSKEPVMYIRGLYHMSFDWLLLCVLNYVGEYTGLFKKNRWGVIILCGLALIDNISIILNATFKHVFDLRLSKVVTDFYVWELSDKFAGFYFHLTFTYLIVFLCVLSLVIKTFRTPWLYKRKYVTILALLLMVLLTNSLYLYFDIKIDLSVILYGIFAIAICYYSLFFKSKRYIRNILSLVVSELNDAIVCYDLDGKCVYYNDCAEKLISAYIHNEKPIDDTIKNKHSIFKKNAEILKAAENSYKEWLKEHHDDNRDYIEWAKQIKFEDKYRYYHIVHRKHYDKTKSYIGCFFTLSDRTAEIEQFNREQYKMTHDELTDLYNRDFFFKSVHKKLEENPDTGYYMLCSNIKSFKLYNDLFGLKKGDEVLATGATLIKDTVPNGSICGRISGDEFAFLVEKDLYDSEKYINVINEMRNKFSSNSYQLNIYVGLYDIEDHSENVAIMCDKCKIAIEAFKEDFNTVITSYDHNLLEKSLYESKIVSEFEAALNNDEFIMYLQPQVSTDGTLLGGEALVRWLHPTKGLIFPGDFIEVFEKTGHIYQLDRYMWEQAAKKLAQWKAENHEDLYISVNISAKDFYYMDIYEELTSIVEKYQINPRNLKIEITETVLMTGMTDQTTLLNRLRKYGFLVEIDDFGSGYSSLNMLKDMDVDIVKIDMIFLREVEKDRTERSKLILYYIISMIKQLGMEVITEGVETKEQVESLTNMGCDVFQGYYFSKPIPIDDFENKYLISNM